MNACRAAESRLTELQTTECRRDRRAQGDHFSACKPRPSAVEKAQRDLGVAADEVEAARAVPVVRRTLASSRFPGLTGVQGGTIGQIRDASAEKSTSCCSNTPKSTRT